MLLSPWNVHVNVYGATFTLTVNLAKEQVKEDKKNSETSDTTNIQYKHTNTLINIYSRVKCWLMEHLNLE